MISFKKIGSVLLLTLLGATLLTQLLPAQRAEAAVSGTWIDAGTIEVAGERYIDTKVRDSMDYYKDGDSSGYCVSYINGFDGDFFSGNNKSRATFHKGVRTDVGGCTWTTDDNFNISGNHLVFAHWLDAGAIQLIDGVEWFEGDFFRQFNELLNNLVLNSVPSQPNLFGADLGTGRCLLTVEVDNSDPSKAVLQMRDGDDCGVVNTFPIGIGSVSDRNKPVGEGTANAGNEGVPVEESCESAAGNLGWIMCPGITLASSVLNWTDTQIQGLLTVDDRTYGNENLEEAWKTIRNIAYVILIPIMLVMVIGTALGFEIFSAYTIKKALPRMVIAVIFITLSWYITSFLIDLANVVGTGILGIMTAPFGQGHNMSLDTLYSGDVVVGAGKWIAFGVGIGSLIALFRSSAFGGIAGAVFAIVGLFVLSALLILMTAYFILVLRQMFIIALAMLAPLAILSWIFPGNDKIWKLWWNSFTKLLIMFPLIMAVLASGRIFAYVISQTGGGSAVGPFVGLMKFVAYVAPYAFIPFAFKFAGGVFANIAGVINNREKGLFDRLRNGRAALRKSAHEDIIGQRNAFSKTGLGRTYQRLAAGGKNGSWSMSGRGRDRWEAHQQKVRDAAVGQAGEADAGWTLNNDPFTASVFHTGLRGGTKQDAIRDFAQNQVAADIENDKKNEAKRLGRALSASEIQAIEQKDRTADLTRYLADGRKYAEQFEVSTGTKIGSDTATVTAQKFRTAQTNTAYEANEEGAAEMQRDLRALIAKGLISEADAATWIKSNRGRTDWSAAGFSDAMNFVSSDQYGAPKMSAKQYLKQAYAGADPREIFGAHTRAAETFSNIAAEESRDAQEALNQAILTGQPEEVIIARQSEADKAAANLESAFQQMRYASPKKADYFADNVLSVPITYNVKVEEEVPVYDDSGRPRVKENGEPLTQKTGKYIWQQKTGTHRQMLEDTKKRVLSSGEDVVFDPAAGPSPERQAAEKLYKDGKIYGADSRMADRGQGGWATRMEGESAEDARIRDEIERRTRDEEK